MAIKYTNEMKDYLREIVPDRPYKEVLALFNQKFNTDLKLSALRSSLKRFRILNGFSGFFTKGMEPWNKSTKGLSKSNRTSFKKGNKPANFRPVGSERIDRDGYTLIKINNEGSMRERWTAKHKYLWEKYNKQKVPKGHAVIFADQDKRNFNKENLILVSKAELLKLNKNKLLFDNPEATMSGINIAELLVKIEELKRRKNMNSIDNINSPKHYELEGLNMESIDVIKAALKEKFDEFCLGNVLKYLIRAEKKNGVEDYKKARKYLSWIERTVKVDRDELAKDLSTDWLTIVTCICKNLEAEKALLIDRIFNSMFKGDIETAIIYLDKIIEM